MFRKIHSDSSSASPRASPAKELAGGLMSLFGLPFLAAGIFLTGLYFSGYSKWWQAQKWEEVPCRIIATKLKSGGGKNNTSRATASYIYQFQGREYEGDRVSLQGGSDNIGSFQRDAHRELSSARKNGGEFRCYVNPAAPSESVIYRTLRWEMQAFMAIFALTFPAVGAGLVVGGLLSMRQQKAAKRLRAAHPGERWKWKPAWAGSAIPEDSMPWDKAIHGYTAWFWLVVTPLLAAMLASGAFQGNSFALLALILPAIGLVPVWFSLKRIRHRAAVGETSFELETWPPGPGDELRGEILLAHPLPLRGTPEATLECVKSTIVSNGKNRSTRNEELWSQRQTLSADALRRDLKHYRLRVKFLLPHDATESSLGSEDGVEHRWKLHFKVPGSPVHSTFEIPVFRKNTSPASAKPT